MTHCTHLRRRPGLQQAGEEAHQRLRGGQPLRKSALHIRTPASHGRGVEKRC